MCTIKPVTGIIVHDMTIFCFGGSIMGIASLVFGILGLCLTLFSAGSLGIVGLICGIAGIVLGALAKKNKSSYPKLTSVGFYLSLCSAILGIVLFAACTAIVASIARSI